MVYCFNDLSILICQTLGLGMRKDQHLPGSPMPLGSSAMGMSFLHAGIETAEICTKHRPPSFSWTNTTALHHTLLVGWIAPESNISCRCMQTSSTSGGGICLNCSLNRVLLVTLITCSVEWVQPSSLGSKEKTLWCSAKRDWVEFTRSDCQESNPLKSSSLNNFSCHCFTVNFGGWRLSGLIQCLHHTSLYRWLWHLHGCNCSHYWNLFPQGLGKCHTISHYYSNLLTASAQLHINILYC